jgi:ribosomal protein S18 acetylase RimI-like enzyme
MILIREATFDDAAGIARAHVNSWRTTYAGLVSDDVLANLSYERREVIWRQVLAESQEVLYVAEGDDGQIVGFANGGRERTGDKGFDGELYAIYLVEDHQKQGFGSQLTLAVAKKLAGLGMRSLFVWVLSDNPARAFYEKIGGQRVTEQELQIGETELFETGYGWRDIEKLIEDLEGIHS